MSDVFVLDSPAIEAAVRFHSEANHPPRRTGRNYLKEQSVTAGGATSGMFAVSYDGVSKLSIKGGITDLRSSEPFPDTVLEPLHPWHNMAILLLATLQKNTWVLSAREGDIWGKDIYTPGEVITYPLAVFLEEEKGGPLHLHQLHPGGMVSFREIYYIEQ